ncbi:MAG: plasmid mobilization relaxosome protein MobC [Bacteroidetes bacterium]|nr:plasmid mobilization relaxosome protein MobC [Bacteroidota bacterium]MBS1748249.1 plasmid mobilization relaxosome protein MobC [Bacteroidota bacterium]
MISETNNRTRWLHIRLTEMEYKKLHVGFSTSTKQKISSYARDILLDKPVTVYTRNQSLDDFVAEMILLRNELKAIGNNINQAVKKLHTSTNNSELKYWAQQVANSREILFQKMDEINLKIASISDQWLQE